MPEKRGKGIQHLTSSFWIYDMGVFIQRNFTAMQIMAKYAFERSEGLKAAERASTSGTSSTSRTRSSSRPRRRASARATGATSF